VGRKHQKDYPYFAAIDDEMDHGGREALLYHLLHFDLSTVNLREIPKTAALFEQQVSSLSGEQSWWLARPIHQAALVLAADVCPGIMHA